MSYPYDAVIREYQKKSCKVLARVVNADLQDFPSDYTMRHNGSIIDHRNTDIDDLLVCPANPLQIYKPIKNGFPIEIWIYGLNSIEVTVTSKDTIKVVKLKIYQKLNDYPPHVQKLSSDKSLKGNIVDFVTLKDLGITKPGGKLYLRGKKEWLLQLENLKAMAMPNLRDTFLRSSNDSDNTPKWARYGNGVNLVTICENPKCSSNAHPEKLGKKEIIHRKGYGAMRFNLEKLKNGEDQLACPACPKSASSSSSENPNENSGVIVKGLILCNARSVLYLKTENDEMTKIARDIVISKSPKWGGTYKELPVDAKMMEIYVVGPERSPFVCVRCDTKVIYEDHELKLSCGHVYHNWCKPMMTGCKVCESNVFLIGKTSELVEML